MPDSSRLIVRYTSMLELQHDVTVIGAGWSGLLACKHMLEEGLTVTVLERRATIGGVWQYSDDPSETSVMRSTQCTSSITVTEMSDFPMPDEFNTFPTHSQIITYLESYADHFKLRPHIRLNVKVDWVEKEDNCWNIHTTSSEMYRSKYLVICTGIYEKINDELQHTLFKDYTGALYHSKEIKFPLEQHTGHKILIFGGGETASDIVSEWYDLAHCIYWSIPRGQHFFRKYARILPWGKPQPLDKSSSRAIITIAPYQKSKPGLSWLCKWVSNGSLLAYQGHGIPEWKNDSPPFHFTFNKNGKVLDLVDYKKVIPKGAIERCEDTLVQFADSTNDHFDAIIMCTGYNLHYFPFLPEKYKNKTFRDRYKFVFDVEDPSIAFIGYVRPMVGAIPSITEVQSRWVAKVFARSVPLKPLELRQADVITDSAYWEDYFKNSSQRLEALVEGFTYTDDVARLAGIFPDYKALLLRNPKGWFTAVFSPYNGATYRLNELAYEKQALETMDKHRKETNNPIYLPVVVFMRVSGIDRTIIARLENVKYAIQISWWWPYIRDLRVVRALNWIWCLPKRALFNTTSTA